MLEAPRPSHSKEHLRVSSDKSYTGQGNRSTAAYGGLSLVSAALSLFLIFAASPTSAQIDFDASEVLCGEFVGGQRAGSPSHAKFEHGRLWVLGYLAGYYVGSDDTALVSGAAGAEPIYDTLLQMCRGFPETSLQSVSMLTLTTEGLQLPTEPIPGFRPESYTCAQYTAIKASGDAATAEAAELWAFAFLQGYQNVKQPYVVIPVSNMSSITSVITNGCRNDGDTLFLDYATGVAMAVRVDAPR
jgi:hypothetical protein